MFQRPMSSPQMTRMFGCLPCLRWVSDTSRLCAARAATARGPAPESHPRGTDVVASGESAAGLAGRPPAGWSDADTHPKVAPRAITAAVLKIVDGRCIIRGSRDEGTEGKNV